MTDRSSRHASLPTYRREVPGGPADAELYTPRLRTRPPVQLRHVVVGGDRLDLVAYRYLDDPHRWWLIADANPDDDVDALTEPGRALAVPPPDAGTAS